MLRLYIESEVVQEQADKLLLTEGKGGTVASFFPFPGAAWSIDSLGRAFSNFHALDEAEEAERMLMAKNWSHCVTEMVRVPIDLIPDEVLYLSDTRSREKYSKMDEEEEDFFHYYIVGGNIHLEDEVILKPTKRTEMDAISEYSREKQERVRLIAQAPSIHILREQLAKFGIKSTVTAAMTSVKLTPPDESDEG